MWLVNHSRVQVCATLRPFLSTKDIQEDQVSTYSQASNKQAVFFSMTIIRDSEAQTLLPLHRCIQILDSARKSSQVYVPIAIHLTTQYLYSKPFQFSSKGRKIFRKVATL